MLPETMEEIVRKIVDTIKSISIKIAALYFLNPWKPQPAFRFDRVVPVLGQPKLLIL